jgi:hypothetical protein
MLPDRPEMKVSTKQRTARIGAQNYDHYWNTPALQYRRFPELQTQFGAHAVPKSVNFGFKNRFRARVQN